MAWTYISKAQFSKAKWLRDMEARDRLAGLVPVMESKVPAGDSHSERPACSWVELVLAILSRGFNPVN